MKFTTTIALLLSAAALAGCSTALPPGAQGSARLAPVHQHAPDPLHDLDGCMRRSDIQCSGGN